MDITTFGAFTTARLGIYAAQKALNVTGNNIANINTTGYTRQAVDQVSLRVGATNHYASANGGVTGSGVLVTGMLILQRKPGESLLIGDEIEVTVVSVEPGGRVRLAIRAPRSMTILRNELRKAMARMESPSPSAMKIIETEMGRRFSTIISSKHVKVGGIDFVASLMNNIDRSSEKSIFDGLSVYNQELADEIRKRMFVFEDLVNMAQAAPVQIQTQEILPVEPQTQIAVPVEMLTVQQPDGQTVLQSSEPPAVLQSAVLSKTGEPEVFGQQKAPVFQTAQDTEISQTPQTSQTPGEVTVTVQSDGSQSNESTDEQSGDTGLPPRDGHSETLRQENADVGIAQPLFRNVETVPVKVGETPVADTKQPDLDAQLAKQIGTTLENGAQQVKIQLTPESLGALTIDLTRTQDGALQVVLHTTTEKAANLLSQHAENLGALLQGNTQNTVQVEVQRQEQNQQFQQQSQQQNQQHDL